MVQIPTTNRQYYDTIHKQSSLDAYAKGVGSGLSQMGSVMDDIQNVKITASLSDAKNKIKLKELELRNKYESNPDDPAFKQEFDAYVNTVYDEQRTNINPFYRGAFNQKARELTKLLNTDNDTWRFKQNGVNLENDMKRIADGLMMDAYDAGNTGDYATAEQVFEQNMATLMPAANKYLGSEKAKKALEEMKKTYLAQFAQGMIDDNPTGAEALLNDKAFEQKVGGEKLIGLKRSLKKAQKAEREKARKEAIRQAKDNATEARRLLAEARRAEKERQAEEKERQKEEKSAVKDALDKEKQEQAYRDKIEAETGRRFKYNFETGNYYLSDEKTTKALAQEEKERKAEEKEQLAEEKKQAQREEKARINRSVEMAGLMEDFPDKGAFDENASVSGDSETIGELGETGTLESGEQELKSIMGDEAYNADKAEREKEREADEAYDQLIIEANQITNTDEAQYVLSEIKDSFGDKNYIDANGDLKEDQLYFDIAKQIPILNSLHNRGLIDDSEYEETIDFLSDIYGDKQKMLCLQRNLDIRDKLFPGTSLLGLGPQTREETDNDTWFPAFFNFTKRLIHGADWEEKAKQTKAFRKRMVKFGNTIRDNILIKTKNDARMAALQGDFEGVVNAYRRGSRELIDVDYPELKGKKVGDVVVINGYPVELKTDDGFNIYVKIKG